MDDDHTRFYAPRVGTRWRRGFFRLWLVISLVWIAAIVALGYGSIADLVVLMTSSGTTEIAEPVTPPAAGQPGKPVAAPVAAEPDARIRQVVDLLFDGRLVTRDAAAPPPLSPPDNAGRIALPDGSTIQVPPDTPVSELPRVVQAAYRRHQITQARQEAGIVLGVALIPPVALLILGLIGGWVARGFRP